MISKVDSEAVWLYCPPEHGGKLVVVFPFNHCAHAWERMAMTASLGIILVSGSARK